MRTKSRARKAPSRGYRPNLESVEARLVLSTILASPAALDGAAGSLRAAITTADNENSNVVNILATPGTYTLTEGDLAVTGGKITISSTGVGKVNIVATSGDEILDLQSGTLTLNNVGMTGGHASTYGGAIDVESGSTLNLNACSFTNNYSGEYGGAIYNDGDLNINLTTFTGNNGYSYGGAVYNDNYAVVANSTFSANTSEYGGAIYSEGPTGSAIVAGPNISPSTISANLIVNTSKFTGNYGYSYGGAIDGEDIEIITGCSFSGNVNYDDGGGAVYNEDSMILNACSFSGNISDDDGGAVENEDSMTINASTFSNNSSPYDYGGAIYNDESLLINGSSFTSNSSYDSGGAIYNDDSLSVRYSNFAGNLSNDDDGGAIFNDDTLSVVGGAFTSNYAADTGSAIASYNEATATISAATFTKNTTGGNDGYAIDNIEMCGTGPTMTMTNCMVTANDNGVDVDEYSTLNLNGCVITGNVDENLYNDGTANISLSVMGSTDGSGTFNYNG